VNELKTFATHCPDVPALSTDERDDLWRRITGEPAPMPRPHLRPVPAGVDTDLAAHPTPTPIHRRPATIVAAALAIVSTAALAVVLDGRTGTAPASPPPVTQPATIPTTPPTVPPVAAFGTPPRLLLSGDWRLRYYNESGPGAGDFEFASTTPGADVIPGSTIITAADGEELAGEVTPPTGAISGMWTPYDRAQDWDVTTMGTSASGVPTEDAPTSVAGHVTRIFQADDSSYLAIIDTGDGSIELRVPATSRTDLDAILAAVHVASVDEFDAALPDSVVTPQQRAATIADMLTDVPLPAGVDAATLVDQTIYSDRVSLATNVAQVAVCAWLDQWFETRDSDPARRDEALDALESSHHWGMLTTMSPRQSGYAANLWETVDTLRAGGTVSSGAGPVPITRSNATSALGGTW
jgi:hypothetical protein